MGAWLAGTAIVVWRQVHQTHRPPVPGALLGITGLFAALAVVADLAPRWATPVSLVGWGLDLAAFFNALPAGLSGDLSQSLAAQSSGQGGGATDPFAAPQGGGGASQKQQSTGG